MKREIKDWAEPRTWDEFRATGLLFLVNTILHAFGWAISVEIDEETKMVTGTRPLRVRYRGFDEKTQDEQHQKIAKYLADTSPNFPGEIQDDPVTPEFPTDSVK